MRVKEERRRGKALHSLPPSLTLSTLILSALAFPLPPILPFLSLPLLPLSLTLSALTLMEGKRREGKVERRE